jgi:VWFA-related protein
MYMKLAGGALLLAVALGVLPVPADAPRVVRAQAQERDVFVSALDAAGAPVASLDPRDVVVREDGVAREVLRVRRATEPMQLAVLVDNSEAASQPMKDFRDALTGFVSRMADAGHEIAIVSFGDRPTIVTDYSSSAATLRAGVAKLFARPQSGAYLLDAIVEVTRGMERREAQRPVIVAITTEGTEFSNYQYENVLKRLADSSAAFHAMVLTSPGSDDLRDETRNRSHVLDLGTRSTGGRRTNMFTSMALDGHLKSLATELLNQYRVTYARPQSLIPPQRIEVSSGRAGLTVRGTAARPMKGSA